MFEDKQYLNKENVLTDESKETLIVVSDNPDVEYVDDKNNGIILKNLFIGFHSFFDKVNRKNRMRQYI